MAYSEQKDLIQNVKDLSDLVESLRGKVSQVEPSIQEIISIRDQLRDLSNTTLGVINRYESTLTEKTAEMDDLLRECRSQFKQVTNDVEALVQLEVNFSDIRSEIERCLDLSATLADLVKGPFVLMEGESIPISQRVPYKHYLKVTDEVVISGGNTDTPGTPVIPAQVAVSPSMAISFDAP